MSYKPDERDWMAYLYGELEGKEKDRFEQFLLENPEAREQLEKYEHVRGMMSALEDKEVIAPPIVVGERHRSFFDIPYFKTVLSIAASLIILMVCAKLLDIRVTSSGNEVKLSFGEPAEQRIIEEPPVRSLTPDEVQAMINASMQNNNDVLQAGWKNNQEELSASIRKNLAVNSGKIDQLLREASTASQEQIRDYVAVMQRENMQAVREYFQLTSTEQKKYVENLLVDFASYLQQQRNNDLKLVENKLNSIEKNTDTFKQETEQILTSIISTVGSPGSKGVKN